MRNPSAGRRSTQSEADIARMYPRTFALRRQHAEILEIGAELAGIADVSSLTRDAAKARSLVAALAGKLTVHLAMEDRSLYPRLANSADAAVRKLAEEFVAEMGGLSEAFGKYVASWPDARTIERDATGFARETLAVLDALRKRIEREDARLYPLVDAGAGAGRQPP